MTKFNIRTRDVPALLLAGLMLAACSAPAPAAPTALAVPTLACDQPETIAEDPAMASALQDALGQRKIRVTRAVAVVHSVTCPGATEPAITRIDFELDINVSDITAPIMLATPIYWSTQYMDDIAPPVPGDILITYESTGQTELLRFTRDDARRATASGDIGLALLASLRYAPVLPAGDHCTEIWARQPLTELTRLARDAFEQKGLSKLAVSASVIGRKCGDEFKPVQSEIQVMAGLRNANKSTRVQELGDATVRIFDALLGLPREQMPGDASPRIVVIEDWNIRRVMVTTMADAEPLLAQGLSGAEMFEAAGYR